MDIIPWGVGVGCAPTVTLPFPFPKSQSIKINPQKIGYYIGFIERLMWVWAGPMGGTGHQ